MPDFIQYIEDGGEYCPYCQSLNILGGAQEITRGDVYHSIVCGDCKKEWTDIYELAYAEPFGEDEETEKTEFLVVHHHKHGDTTFVLLSDHEPTEKEVIAHLEAWDPETEWVAIISMDRVETFEL